MLQHPQQQWLFRQMNTVSVVNQLRQHIAQLTWLILRCSLNCTEHSAHGVKSIAALNTWLFCHLGTAQNKSLLWLLSSHINFVIAYTRTTSRRHKRRFDALTVPNQHFRASVYAMLWWILMLFIRFRQQQHRSLLSYSFALFLFQRSLHIFLSTLHCIASNAVAFHMQTVPLWPRRIMTMPCIWTYVRTFL